ncbi:metal-dependent phosphohydrolase, partial [Streptomyces sp. SID7760]|nr:metal-dependent phosphohydrolase [Streptomyces sp. SID7760]
MCAALAACAATAPALAPGSGTPWPAVGLLAFLYLGCELLRICPLPGIRVPEGIGSFFPVLLAAVFLLPPAAAALVALPGALAQAVAGRPAWIRRVW